MARIIRHTCLVGAVLAVTAFAQLVNSDKILMNAILGEGSHFLCAASVGERLVERGHNVTFLISNAYAHRASDPKFASLFDFEIFHHPIPVEDIHAQFSEFNAYAFKPASSQMWTLAKVMRDGRVDDCDALMQDTAMMDRLAMANFSMVLYDIGWVCPVLLAERLNLRYAGISAVSTPCSVTEPLGSISHPAFVPSILSGFPNRMDFRHRVLNTLVYLFIKVFGLYFNFPFNSLKNKYDIASDRSFQQLFSKSEFFLVNSDFSVEFPCAMPPNVFPVGGLTTRPSDPLPKELEQFMQSSGDHGVVVCSMGTYFTLVPPETIKDFLNAFGRLPQKVIFQLRKVPPGIEVPPNVMTLPWLPQNDLLGHEKTRVFMYQGGNNGFYEALYHAIPIVVVPIHGDQYDTGAKVTVHGLGITIDKLTMKEDTIYDALREVTTNVSYARTTQRLSGMYRDRPLAPAERAAFWVDHVIKYGAAQYQLPLVDQNVFQRNLVDVMLFIMGCLILSIIVLVVLCGILLKVIKSLLRILYPKNKLD